MKGVADAQHALVHAAYRYVDALPHQRDVALGELMQAAMEWVRAVDGFDMAVVERFLNYSFRDIGWSWDGLTAEEKKLCTKEQFAALRVRFAEAERDEEEEVTQV